MTAVPDDEPTSPSTPSAKLKAAAKIGAVGMDEVIDVSEFQGSAIDWQRVKAAGVKGVIVKATDGLGSPDPLFEHHAKGAAAADLWIGAYHYMHMREAPRPQDVVQQAREFAKRYNDAGCRIWPGLDVEPDDNPHGIAGKVWLQAAFDCACEMSLQTRSKAIVYSYLDFWKSLGPEQFPELEICGSWVAWYGATPIVLSPWGSCDLWQYTGKGTVPGIAGNVDRSRTLGPIEGILRDVAPPSVPPASPSTSA